MSIRSIRKHWLKMVAMILLFCIMSLCLSGCSLFDGQKYDNAVALYQSGKYDEAIAAFSEIEQYEDSSTFIMYIKTLQLAESGEYALAASTFETMGSFRDSKYLSIYYSARQAEEDQCYEDADAMYRTIVTFSDSSARLNALPDLILQRDFTIAANGLNDGSYDEEDQTAFAGLITKQYSDSETRMKQDIFDLADGLLTNGKYEMAYALFCQLEKQGYSNAATRIQDCQCAYVKDLMNNQEYTEAYTYVNSYLSNHPAANDLRKECAYYLAEINYTNQQYATAYAFYLEANDYSDAGIKRTKFEEDYNTAVQFLTDGEYEQAYTLFCSLLDYSDSSDKATECYYYMAVEMLHAGQYDSAIEAFHSLGNYADSPIMLKESYYQKANAMNLAGCYDEAYVIYAMLYGYSNVNSIIRNDKNIAAARRDTFVVGNTVYFGEYEQDGNLTNGSEAIEWIVLNREDDVVFLVSKYALDSQQYHRSNSSKTWETCFLRTWLNDSFMNAAFSSEEQQAIKDTTLSNTRNRQYDTTAGNDTVDKVFLMSIDEAKELFSSDRKRRTEPTKYAVDNGAGYNSGYCWYWLRSPGGRDNYAARVNAEGSIDYWGYDVNTEHVSIRPAIYIDLNKLP